MIHFKRQHRPVSGTLLALGDKTGAFRNVQFHFNLTPQTYLLADLFFITISN